MKICFLPLDSRPCTSLFPRQLAALRGCTLTVPPENRMDYFKTPSQTEEIWAWLERETADAHILVLSVEQLVYGGLIASRGGGCPADQAKRSLIRLERLKERSPRLKIYASNVLMRTTVSTLSRKSQIWWEQIARYSGLKYAAITEKGEKQKQAEKNLELLEAKIPASVLEEFLLARQRNHMVNMECVRLAKAGVFERLLILQEDCSALGLQVLEQNEIREAVREAGLHEKVFLHNGTDAAGMELVLYALSAGTGTDSGVGMDIRIEWLWENRGFTAKYEDRPFTENLKSHMQAAGIRETKEADQCLLILPPRSVQGDYCPKWENPDSYTQEEYEAMAQSAASLINQGNPCYLLDVSYANGGDLRFMKQLARMTEPDRLCGYAAWNTAGNSLGTILAQILACRGHNTQDNQRFTAERLLDDLLYQAAVRQTFSERLAGSGEDVWCLKDSKGAEKLLEQAVQMHRADFEAVFAGKLPEFSIRLPWPRVFEAEVIADK